MIPQILVRTLDQHDMSSSGWLFDQPSASVRLILLRFVGLVASVVLSCFLAGGSLPGIEGEGTEGEFQECRLEQRTSLGGVSRKAKKPRIFPCFPLLGSIQPARACLVSRWEKRPCSPAPWQTTRLRL